MHIKRIRHHAVCEDNWARDVLIFIVGSILVILALLALIFAHHCPDPAPVKACPTVHRVTTTTKPAVRTTLPRTN